MPYYPITEEEKLKPFAAANKFLQSNPAKREFYSTAPQTTTLGTTNMTKVPSSGVTLPEVTMKSVHSPNMRNTIPLTTQSDSDRMRQLEKLDAAGIPFDLTTTDMGIPKTELERITTRTPTRTRIKDLTNGGVENIQGSQRSLLEQQMDLVDYYQRYPKTISQVGPDGKRYIVEDPSILNQALRNVATLGGADIGAQASRYGADIGLEKQRLAGQTDLGVQNLRNIGMTDVQRMEQNKPMTQMDDFGNVYSYDPATGRSSTNGIESYKYDALTNEKSGNPAIMAELISAETDPEMKRRMLTLVPNKYLNELRKNLVNSSGE